MTILENFLKYLILHDKLPKWFKKYINNKIKNELENKKVLNYLKQLSLNELITLFSDKKINDDNYKNILKNIITHLIENNLINKNINNLINKINQNDTSAQNDISTQDDTSINGDLSINVDIIAQDDHIIKCDKNKHNNISKCDISNQCNLDKLINCLYK